MDAAYTDKKPTALFISEDNNWVVFSIRIEFFWFWNRSKTGGVFLAIVCPHAKQIKIHIHGMEINFLISEYKLFYQK